MKRNNGFTLIELLAVIVILAIIALIATPVILNIINNTREQSRLISAKNYIGAVEIGLVNGKKISDGTYPIMSNGNICLGELTNNTCSEDILEVKINKEHPTSGTVSINSGIIKNVNLVYDNKTIVKDSAGNLVYKQPSICKLAEGGDTAPSGVSIGDRYTCEVKKDTKYTFYVLSLNEDGTTNMILDQNLYIDGTLATDESYKDSGVQLSTVWQSSGLNSDGPVDAINYLYSATKDWINVSPLTYTYKDREFQGITEDNIGYDSFISKNGIVTIKALSGKETVIGTKESPLRARLPIDHSSDLTKTEVFNGGENTLNPQYAFLYNYVRNGYFYWTLSSCYFKEMLERSMTEASQVQYRQYSQAFIELWAVEGASVSVGSGIRPVITVQL